MKAHWKYTLDLQACGLEDRLLAVVPYLGPGTIVLTTDGYVLLGSIPIIAADPSSALSATGIPGPLVMAGSGGIANTQPGAGTGVVGLATTAPTGSNGGATVTIFAGSGANDIVAPIISLVTRNTIANDALNAAPEIGRVLGDRSDILLLEQVHRGGLEGTASGGGSADVSRQLPGPNPDEKPADPLPIRIHSRPHRLAAESNPSAG
jgi:hypothetical protein